MALSVADLTTPLTRAQVESSIYRGLATLGVSTTTWKPGAVVRAIITAFALLFAALHKLIANLAASAFLDLSSGDWLTQVAYYVYDVERVTATFAAGEVTLVNTGGGLYTADPGDYTARNPTTGKTYRNAATFTLNPLETITIAVVAVESGSASTSSPNTITEHESGLPTAVTVTNANAIVGQDDELDASLKTRCKEKLGALSPMGPWDAYSFAAKAALRQNGTSVGVTRVKLTPPDGYGNLTMYVATATGGVTGTSGDASTDLGAVHSAALYNAAPLCVTLTTASATTVSFLITYQAWAYNNSGFTEAQIKTKIADALTAYFAAFPIGGDVVSGVGRVYVSTLAAVIRGALPDYIFRVVVSLPATDTILTASQLPVLGLLLGTLTQVAPPDGGL